MSQDELRQELESAAEPAVLAAWKCLKCSRIYQGDLDAQVCCTKIRRCAGCDALFRDPVSYAHCEPCRSQREKSRWQALPVHPWDGKFPIAIYHSDQFFFDEGELESYLEDRSDAKIEDLRLVMCEANNVREFLMSEFLEDSLPEGWRLDETEINQIVNDWIDKHSPFSYHAIGERLDAAEVLAACGLRLADREDGA